MDQNGRQFPQSIARATIMLKYVYIYIYTQISQFFRICTSLIVSSLLADIYFWSSKACYFTTMFFKDTILWKRLCFDTRYSRSG